MAEFEYLDRLDSVQTGWLVSGNVRPARQQAIDLLMLRLLLGARPRLSHNQAFDGAALFEALDRGGGEVDKDLLDLFESGWITVALPKAKTLLEAFSTGLARPNYLLSAWPEVHDGALSMERLRDAVETGDARGLPDRTDARLRLLRLLSRATEPHVVQAGSIADGETLADEVRRSLCGFGEGAVVECLGRLVENGTQNRSDYYRGLRLAENTREITAAGHGHGRQIVDAAYNRVIAATVRVDRDSVAARAGKVAEHLATVAARRRPVAALAAVKPAAAAQRLEPVDWAALGRLVRRYGDLEPAERRRLQARYLAEHEVGDGVRLLRLERVAGAAEWLEVPGAPEPAGLIVAGAKLGLKAASGIPRLVTAARKHRRAARWFGLLEEDEAHG